jgi:hypothetical protein
MTYLTEFSKDDSEYFFQQIEEIKPYLSPKAEFLLEDITSEDQELDSESKKEFSLRLRVITQEKILFAVEASAFSLIDAIRLAKETVIELIQKRDLTLPVSTLEEITASAIIH